MPPSLSELREQLSQAHSQVLSLHDRLQRSRDDLVDLDVEAYARQNGIPRVQFQSKAFVCRRTLQGHTGKIYSMDWSRQPGRDRIVSVSQDGYLIVWNAVTSQKTHAIKLACSWVMTCAFSPNGQTVASGGLDSICSVYTLNSQHDQEMPIPKTLSGHRGYISCCKFVPDQDTHIITSSGDQTCALWESESGQKICVFGGDALSGHSSDVLSLSINASNGQHFVSGSCDRTARLWDTRTGNQAVQTYSGHEGDVNTVQFFPDGVRFGTGSDDSVCRIFDTRTGHQLQKYTHNEPQLSGQPPKANAIGFSASGRLLFSAYSNSDCYIWDTITGKVVGNLKSMENGHSGLISCLGLAQDGTAVCTGSWDQTLKIWAVSDV